MPLTMPKATIQMALTGTIWSPSNWVTIAPFVETWASTRGRQHQQQRPISGNVEFQLTNNDGRFNPWSKNGPYYNKLSPGDSGTVTGTNTYTWTASGVASLATTTTVALYGTDSFKLTTTGTGAFSVATLHDIYAVTPGRVYTAFLSGRAGGSYGKSAKLQVKWYKSTLTLISTVTSASVVPSATTWTRYLTTATAPALAAYVSVVWVGTSAASGDHYYFDCAGLYDVTYVTHAAVTQGWSVGQTTLHPAQPVRILATWTGTTFPVFMGLIDSWAPKYGMIIAEQVVTAHDYMHVLALMPCNASAYAGTVIAEGPELYWRLNTQTFRVVTANRFVLDSSGNNNPGEQSKFSDGPILGYPGGLALTAATSACFLNGPITGTAGIVELTALTVEFLLYLPHTYEGAAALVEFAGGPHLSTIGRALYLSLGGSLVYTSSTLTGWHHIAFTYTKTSHGWVMYLDGAEVGSGTSTAFSVTSTVTIGNVNVFGAFQMQEFAVYNFVLTAATIAQHFYLFTWGLTDQPSGQMIKALLLGSGVPLTAIGTIATGTVTCSPPSITKGQTQLLPTVQVLENTEQGMLYCAEDGLIDFVSATYIESSPTAITSNATFSNDTTLLHFRYLSGLIPALDDQTWWNYCAVSMQSTTDAVFVSKTATSEQKNGARALTGYTGMYFAYTADAQALASYLTLLYSEPVTRVRSITLDSVTDHGNNFPQMLGRRLLDAITVKWQPMDGTASPFSQVSNIEQIKHVVTKERWTTTWQLSAKLNYSWFTLNHPVRGVLAGTGSSAANRLGV